MPTAEQIDALHNRLRQTAVRSPEVILDSTEVYKDLRISGRDLFDLLSWIEAKFHVDFGGMNLGDYAPDEGTQFWPRSPNAFRSITVGSLLRAIDARKWTP